MEMNVRYCGTLPRKGMKGKFIVLSFYQSCTVQNSNCFLWMSIWKTKAPLKAAFFVWAVFLGKILTIDNLRKNHIIVVVCSKRVGRQMTIYCYEVATTLSNDFYSRINLAWVMRRLVYFLETWRGLWGNPHIAAMWKMMLVSRLPLMVSL